MTLINPIFSECKLAGHELMIQMMYPRSCKRSGTLFKSLLFWLAGEVNWLAVEVLSPCQKVKISETKYRSFYRTLSQISNKEE